MTERSEQVLAALAEVRERIARAADAADRDAAAVEMVVVTKFFPASDVRILADLGVTDVGENRHQEAQAKAEECADLELRWHFIGGLQSNKAAAVTAYADVVESVDRAKIVRALDRGAHQVDRPIDVLLQVSLDAPEAAGRAGADTADLPALADAVASCDLLRLGGLMAVAPREEDPATAFARLAGVRDAFVEQHPAATTLSAGMSGDLEQAIAHGATRVRVGSAVLGSRPSVH